MQGWFHIQKAMNLIHDVNKGKNPYDHLKKYMQKKKFDKIQHPFVKSKEQQTNFSVNKVWRKFPKCNKKKPKYLTANIILDGEIVNTPEDWKQDKDICFHHL